MEEIDRTTIKALSAETRLKILKMLSEHRATCADISKRMALSPSTVNEHLKQLEASGLVIRIETGHKWVYYELSGKCKALTAPQQLPVQFVLLLAIGLLLFVGGAFFSLVQTGSHAPQGGRMRAEGAPILQQPEASSKAAQTAMTDDARPTQQRQLSVAAMFVGAVIIIVMLSSYNRNCGR